MSSPFFDNSMPANHKNMARFVPPKMENAFKALLPTNPDAETEAMQLISGLQAQHNQLNQQITKVQKLDSSLEHKPRQMNGNGFNYAGPVSNGFGNQSIIKTESDSNGSSNQSEGRSNMNGSNINGSNINCGINFASFPFLANHPSSIDQQNIAALKNSNGGGVCFGMNLFDNLTGPGPNGLNNLNNLGNFNVNGTALNYLNNSFIANGNLIGPNLINAKMPENAGKRTSSGRKPTNSKEVQLSPEEESKRQQRRERNKEAAARCRKRRVEQTKTLEDETKSLQMQKDTLEKEINFLSNESARLLNMLNHHDCKLNVQAH